MPNETLYDVVNADGTMHHLADQRKLEQLAEAGNLQPDSRVTPARGGHSMNAEDMPELRMFFSLPDGDRETPAFSTNDSGSQAQARGIRYDPTIILQFANGLYARANTIVAVDTLVGLLVGSVAGYSAFQEGGAFIGAIMGGMLGFSTGQAKAFQLKLQAQMALCQAQIEKNTRRV